MFLPAFFFCATVLRIANENEVWEKIIHDKDFKTTRVFIHTQVILVNRNWCVIS